MAKQLTVDRCKTAILIMDYQNRMLNELAEEPRKEILRKANEILSKARSNSIPVIYIEVRRGERTPEMGNSSFGRSKIGRDGANQTTRRPFHNYQPE